MKITQTFLFLVSTLGFSSLFAQAPDSLVGQNMYLTHSSSDSDDSGVEKFYFGQNLLWSRDTYNGEWNDQGYSWDKTSASTGDLTFFWNDYERVDLDVTFTDATNATFTYTSYDLEDNGEVVEGGTGSGTISLVDESYEPPYNHFFVEDFSPDQSSPNKFFRTPGDEFFGLTISQQKGLYSLRGNFTGDPDEDNPNQKHVEIAADSVLSFDQSWTVGGTPFYNFPEQENGSTDYGWSKVRIERTGDDGELHVGLQFRPSPNYGTQVSSSLYYEPKVGSGYENTYDGAYLSVPGEPNLRIVNNANTAILSFEVWKDGSWHTLLSLNTVSGTYSLPHTSENQISGWNSLAGKHAYPLMMFELPASYDSNGEMTVLPLVANQVGFSNYYVAEGLGSPFSDTAPAYLSGYTLNSNDADWDIYDESLTFNQSGYRFGGQITNDQPDPISFADQNYTYEKTGPNSGVLSYNVYGNSFRHILTFESTNSGTYTKFADYGQGNPDVTYGDFSLSGDGADFLIADEIDGGRDSVYLQTSNGPELIEGAGEFGFDIFLPNEPEFSAAELVLNGQTYDLTQDEAPLGFRTRYGYGRGEIHELYDIESYSDTDLSSFSAGAEFIFSLSHNGNDYTFTHNVVAESALPSPPNLSINGDGNWTTDPTEGHEYLKLAPAQTVVVSWDSFESDDEYDHINISLQKWVGDEEDDVFDNEDLVVSADSTSYEFSGDLLEPGQKYTFYVEFVDVTEAFNPEGFRRASQTDDEPILFTYASSITALDMEIVGDGTGPLDGSVIYITGEDSVKETLIFENGSVTSIFDEGEGQEPFTAEGLAYTVEDETSGYRIIIDGDLHYFFYENNSTGTLLDYSNNGQIDQSGSWDFTFTMHEWEEYDDFNDGTLASEKWETGYWDGAQAPDIVDGKARLSSNGSGVGSQQPSFIDDLYGMPDNGTNHSFLSIADSSVVGVEAEISLGSTSSIETGLYLGIFEELDSGPGFAFAGIELGYWDQSGPSLTFENTVYENGTETLDEILQEKPANLGQSYKISVVEGESTYQLFLDNELVQEYPIRGELLSFHFGAFHDSGASFETFVDNVRVIRRSDIGSNEPVLVVDEIEAQRDLVYLQTQYGPVLSAGDGEINFEIFLPQQPQFTAAELEVDGITYDLTQDEAPEGFRTRYGYGRGEINELYDIESSSANDWSAYTNGKAFNFTLTHDGVDFNYSHYLPGESALPSPPNISINGDVTWATDPEEGHEYVKLIPAENVVVSWDPYQGDGEHGHIYIALTEWVGEDDENDVLEEVLSAGATSFEFSRDLLKAGRQYSLYVEFANITEAIDPNGFKRAHQGDEWPILSTYASSITALDMEIMEYETSIPVYYLSSENLAGLGVLGQVAGYHALIEEKLWDGAVNQEVTKFSFTPAEMVQEGNNDLGWVFVEGATSQQLPASYDDNKQALNQYFESNGISVVGYIIEQQDGNGTVTYNYSDESFYLYNAQNGIPVFWAGDHISELIGSQVTDELYGPLYFSIVHATYWGNPGGAGWTEFETFRLKPSAMVLEGASELGWAFQGPKDGYELIGAYQGIDHISQYFESNGISVQGYIARQQDDNNSGETSTLNWEQYDDFSSLIGDDSGSGYAPESIVGSVVNMNLNFTEGVEQQTETFFTGRVVFHNGGGDFTYYNYEKISDNQARITYTFEDEADPMPEVVNLTFTSPTQGTFDWAEYSDTSLTNILDQSSGDFSLVGFIDPKKWDLTQWDGGMVPVIENGKMKFSGQPNSSESLGFVTKAMLERDSNAAENDPESTQPHSILEFVESQNIKGIELTFSIPSNSPNLMGFGLFAVDYDAMFKAANHDDEMSALRFEFDFWNEDGSNAELGFYARDPITDEESSVYRNIEFDTSYRVAFVREESSIRFYLDDELIGEYPYQDRDEYFIVRAMNEVNAPFTTYLENVRIIRRDDTEHFEEIYVSGGSMSYPHYSFNNSNGDVLDMQEFEFQPDTKYRFIAENLDVSHPFTIGASINGSDIIKFTKITQPDLPEPEEHNFTGVTEDLDVISNELLMPPVELDFGDDYVLNLNGDYFDLEYSNDWHHDFVEHDVKFYYICDFHSSMNGRLYLGWEEHSEGYPIYELNDNQIMDVTGLSWTELEASTPNARFIQNFGGKFALIEKWLDGHYMPYEKKLFPVIQDQDDDWVFELPNFEGFNSYERVYFDLELGLVPVGFFQYKDDDNGSGNGDIELDGSVIWIEVLNDPNLVREVLTFKDGKVTKVVEDFATISPGIELSYEYFRLGENNGSDYGKFTITTDIYEGDQLVGYEVYEFVETSGTGSHKSLRFDGSGEGFDESNIWDFTFTISKDDEFEEYPVFWVTPELFWELTYIDWEWTSFAKFEDPQMGRGAYFAFEDSESSPPYYDPVDGEHEILESYNLIHVTELVPVGLPSVWMASPNLEIYNTQVSPETLKSEHNLTIVGYYTPQKREDLLGKVEEFLNNFKSGGNGDLLEDWVNVVYAEKLNDAINPNRSIFLADLNNDVTIYFDQDGDFVHSSITYYDNWYRNDGVPTEIVNSIEAEFPGAEILELWDEVSELEGLGFVYRAVVESNSSELFEIYLNNTGEKVHLVTRFFGQIERQFPEVAHEYMEQNYRWEDDDTPRYYWTWFDEYQEEFVAVLEDGTGREVRFSKEGEFLREFDPWGPPEEDAGISFNPNWSAWGTDLTSNNFDGNSTGGDNPAFVRIEKLELGQSDDVNYSTDDPYMPPMWGNEEVAYRVSLTNSQLDEDANLSLSDLELGSTVLPAGTPLKLSFTYESGDPRYLLVSGAKIRGYKHTWPEHWLDRPGTFTILAETTDPVSTTVGNLESTFGIVVVMGGERHYHNSIFQANVPVIDLQPAQQISPYDQVAAFSVSSEVTEDLNVSAFLPRNLLEWNFGISEPHRVKAGLLDNNGTLYFINGSGADDPDALTTGGGFTRILHEGYEPDIYFDPYSATGGADPSNEEESAKYKLGDHESDEGFVDEEIEENASARVKQSKFDFNADGYGDSLLEVRFFADVFPADIGFGDPYVEPALVGQVTGRILDGFNNTIPEFGIWFFHAPDGINGPWEPTFFEVDIDYETGEYTASLPEGEFYAEAWGNDWENGIYFTPEVSTTSFTIEEGSSDNYDFNLVKEWRPGAYGEIHSSLEVNGQVGEEHHDVSIELFPVDETGKRLTEWSSAWLWVEPNGRISGSAPEGRHEVVLYSYDNSIRLSDGPIFWTVVANQVNEFTPLVAQKSLPVRVSGMIRDAEFGEGIWADVVFVDPNDENIIFWPIWDDFNLGGDIAPEGNPDELVTFAPGVYSVRIPAGSYKIKAIDWSGFYAEEYFQKDGNGTADFSQASVVEISSNTTEVDLTSVNFTLSAGSVSQINLRVLDKNTNEPLPYVWFDFLDAYDEYGPTTFPRVDYSDDGIFTLRISAGSYKLVIGSHEHERLVLARNIDGNYTWEEGDWSSAAILEISDDQPISLPDALMDGGSIPPPPPPAGDSTISGKVLTGKGVAVPKAEVTLHTDDWMFYFVATSRNDGSYEFEGLPSGNWIISAYPPYDSSEFTNLQPTVPNWDNPIELGENESADFNLILTGSNVSGRIMYPKKDENDRVRLKPLPYAWLWAFEDENQTGEPPIYEYGIYLEQPAFNEAYGNTDEDGFFSFSLKEAGKYSMRIEIPGELGSFSLDPIHFEVRDPNQELTLGNAIRLDWTKSEARATTYKVERKSSSSNSYTTVDNNISGSLKSFVDHTIVPGATYEYRVTAVSASGSQVLSTDSYKVSKPFIYLAPPSKTIVGKVRNDLNASISGAEVQAWKIDGTGGWASAVTDVNGDYELNVGSGKWEVMVYKPWDRQVNWSYDKAPKQVNFADNGNKVEKKANFIVTTMSGGISGVIEIPTDLSDYYSYIWIDAWNPDGVGNWTNPEADGSFALPLSPGEYTISLWLDPAVFSGYNGPEARVIKVGKSELDLGNIQLVQYVPTVISGIIATADGTPLGNADVWAWSIEGGWAEDVTDSDGSYTLNVSPGTWEIGFNPPMPKDGSASPYLPAPPKRIKIVDSDKALNFTVRKAGAKVKGVVNGTGGSPIADLYAWAYAREVTDENSSDEFNDVVAEVEVSPRGEFSFPAVPGTYAVGLWLFSEEYLFPEEQILTLSEDSVLTDENGTVLEQITFTLAEVSSRVEGVLIDKETNQSIDGLIGEVYAMSLDGQGRQYTVVESNGSYSMLLAPGKWILEYYIEDDQGRNYPKESVSPVRINLAQGETETANFILSSASATISGAVVYDSNGSAVTNSTVYVWAYREDSTAFSAYGNEVETDENGAFSISVLQGGKYEVGVTLSSDLRVNEYFEPTIQKVTMNTSSKSGVVFRLAKPEEDNYISGSVVDELGNPIGGASVYAWTFDGAETAGLTNENGEFNMTVTSGSSWKVGAEYIVFDDNDSEIIYLIEEELNANLRVNEYVEDIRLVLNKPAFDIPDGKSVTFDPSKDFITTLPDGTEITIPAGAVNVSSDVDSVRFVVTPTASGLDKSGALKPAGYVYSLELFDNRGKLIEGNFKKDVIIRMPIDVEVIRSQGLNADTLKGTYYSPTKKKWETSKTSTWDKESGILTMTTDHFSPNGPSADALEPVFDIENNTTEIPGADNWYDSDWLGTFYDASVDSSTWFYHTEEKLGWLWIVRDSEESGNYWFYHSGNSDVSSKGWLWTGGDYFVEGDDTKSHFYSSTLGRWLYFHPDYGFYDYEANGGSYLD